VRFLTANESDANAKALSTARSRPALVHALVQTLTLLPNHAAVLRAYQAKLALPTSSVAFADVPLVRKKSLFLASINFY
jgi:hypothetical protein